MAKKSRQVSSSFGLKTFPESKVRFTVLAGMFLAVFVFSVIYYDRIADSLNGPTAFESLETPFSEARDSLNTTRENNVLTQINNHRTSNGRSALKLSDDFTTCSEKQAVKGANAGGFTTSSHLSTASAITNCSGNSSWTYFVENFTWGGAPVDAFNNWKGSGPHNTNMLDSNINCAGLAMITKDGSEYWVFQGVKLSSCDVPSSGGSTSSQLLANTSFESAVTGGVSFSSVRELSKWFTYAASGSQAYRGSSCCAWNGSYVIAMKDYNSSGVTSTTQLVRGYAGSKYNLTAHTLWFRGPAQSMYLDFLNSSYQRISVSGNPKIVVAPASRCNTTNGWCTLTTGAITAPSGTYYVRVILYSGQATTGSEYYWDGVTLTRT